MQQISLFDDEKIAFPATHEDILKLHATYVDEGETDGDAFTWSDIKNGRSYFFYGKKAYVVTIENVIVFPQCYGAVAELLPTMKAEELIVDIGSWTVDTLMIINHSVYLTRISKF